MEILKKLSIIINQWRTAQVYLRRKATIRSILGKMMRLVLKIARNSIQIYIYGVNFIDGIIKKVMTLNQETSRKIWNTILSGFFLLPFELILKIRISFF